MPHCSPRTGSLTLLGAPQQGRAEREAGGHETLSAYGAVWHLSANHAIEITGTDGGSQYADGPLACGPAAAHALPHA